MQQIDVSGRIHNQNRQDSDTEAALWTASLGPFETNAYVYTPDGRSAWIIDPGQGPAPIIDLVREHQIPVIFSESTISDRPARQIAAEAGVRYGGVLYVDSLSGPDGRVPTYLDLLKVTTQTISDGFRDALGL